MAYAPHSRLTVAGSWEGDISEIWEWTLSLCGPTGSGPVTNPDAFLLAAAPIVSAFHSAQGSEISPDAQLLTLKIASIGADGKYVGEASIYDYNPSISGGAQDSTNPGFCCMAITLQSAVLRGPGSRGRFYPPNCCFPVQGKQTAGGSVFLVDAAHVGPALAAARTMLNALAGTNDCVPVIASRVNGTNSAVTGLSMNDIADTQRRRKNKIKGTRQTVNL